MASKEVQSLMTLLSYQFLLNEISFCTEKLSGLMAAIYKFVKISP